MEDEICIYEREVKCIQGLDKKPEEKESFVRPGCRWLREYSTVN
jgi:hypothetical protein